MQLFYSPEINSKSSSFSFSKEESRHIIKVLRKNEGDLLHITDGHGRLYDAEIAHAGSKKCVVHIRQSELKTKPWDYYLHIAIAPTKMNERMEWFLEKATEIGIDEITPVICDHSERRVIKSERMQKVLISAMKQSLKYELPKLNEAIPLRDFLELPHKGLKLIAHCQESERTDPKLLIGDHKSILMMIGPEGDFSDLEISKALDLDFLPVSLGNSRLRTETAGVVACHMTSMLHEKSNP